VYPEPPDVLRHEEVFACPVRFGGRANRALLRDSDLDLPLAARDSAMAELHARLVDDELQRLGRAPTSRRVRQALAARLEHGEPRRHDVAAALHVSDRTLQRRLHREGTSFRELLDETRRALAEHHLRRSHDPLCRIADLLGFEDQSNFFRACKRWFGASPSRYRASADAGDAAAPPADPRHPARLTAIS
jgi:AraC-like DNA-binding protein